MKEINKQVVSAEVYVDVPMTPNFLKISGKKFTISISELPVETLEMVGKAWTQELINKASKKIK